MGLFKADLYRSFAIGFAAGALMVLGAIGFETVGGFSGDIVPAASAAPAQ
ncbi:MAG TPA: hypothetical protein VGE05_14670 [Novosphingobium sp.]